MHNRNQSEKLESVWATNSLTRYHAYLEWEDTVMTESIIWTQGVVIHFIQRVF